MNASSSVCRRLLDKLPLYLLGAEDGEPALVSPGFCFQLNSFCLSAAQIPREVSSHSKLLPLPRTSQASLYFCANILLKSRLH